MALVGILESLLTAKPVDDITDTHDKTREAWGQGASNVITGFFGGMAGVFLLILVVGFGDVVAVIPMAALVAVLIMVSVGTFDWHSIQPATLRRMPKSETTVLPSTVVLVAATHNLAIGVGVRVLVAMTLFARRVAHLTETNRELVEDTHGNAPAIYRSPASCSSPPATTSPPSSSTSTTPTAWSSTGPSRTSGKPRPMRSSPSTNARARASRPSG